MAKRRSIKGKDRHGGWRIDGGEETRGGASRGMGMGKEYDSDYGRKEQRDARVECRGREDRCEGGQGKTLVKD